MDACVALLMQTVKPRLVWRRFPRNEADAFLLSGKDIQMRLADSTELVLFAATLGMESELLLHRAQIRDMTQAVLLDACADAAIENVCDNFCADLSKVVAPRFLTERFSPGYGDFPLCQQRVIFDALDITRRIGVTYTDSGLMIPQKSVTAIVGISDSPQPHKNNKCAFCRMLAQCSYRKENKRCE